MGNSREAAFQRFCKYLFLTFYACFLFRFKTLVWHTALRLSAQGNLRHWIEDPDCRDQYSVIYEAGERTAIFNNDSKDPITVEERAVSEMLGSI